MSRSKTGLAKELIAVRIPPHLHGRVRMQAERIGISFADFVTMALEGACDHARIAFDIPQAEPMVILQQFEYVLKRFEHVCTIWRSHIKQSGPP